jgi:hypothetical protein
MKAIYERSTGSPLFTDLICDKLLDRFTELFAVADEVLKLGPNSGAEFETTLSKSVYPAIQAQYDRYES